ncbi:hypothetical protein [Streptomyces sp. B21-083]|uniref:hypothetical protein n=1 Tax=Streptomyces sp. B21-083 TaxID=3039410 RepID=UPI002FEF73BE
MNPAQVHRPVLLVAAALLLGGCGIPTTGVVGSGDPATGVRSTATVYLPGKLGLIRALRRVPQRVDAVAAVKLVFQGPSKAEREAGVVGLLPKPEKDPVVRTDGTRVTVELRFDDRPEYAAAADALSALGLEPLACTLLDARQAEDPDVESVEVVVKATTKVVERQWTAEGNNAVCAKSVPFSAATPWPRTGDQA